MIWSSPRSFRHFQNLHLLKIVFSPTAGSFGVSAQIGSGVVQGGPEVRFHEGSTRVQPGFNQGSVRALKKTPPELFFPPCWL